MKKLLLLFAASCMLVLTACDGTTNSEEPAEVQHAEMMKGKMEYDLNDYNLPLIIIVPDSNVAPIELIEQEWGSIEIKVGKYFQIQIAEGGDMELMKSDLTGDMFTNTILEEEPNVILYKSEKEGIKTMYHFYMIINVDGIDYEIQDIKSGGDFYPERAVRNMFELAKLIKSSNTST